MFAQLLSLSEKAGGQTMISDFLAVCLPVTPATKVILSTSSFSASRGPEEAIATIQYNFVPEIDHYVTHA